MRTQKVYIPTGICLVLLAIGFLALRSDVPDEPIKIYKATTPLPKQTLRDKTPSPPNSDVHAENTPPAETAEASEINISPVDVSNPFLGGERPPTEAEPVSEEQKADIPVSPHGFGPYPKLPSDWPEDYWDIPMSEDHELQARVWIKLLSEGKPVQGMTTLNGLLYPIMRGTRYVQWKEAPAPPDGKVRRYIQRSTGHPADRLPKGKWGITFESDIPSSIEVVSYEDGGIDPYRFLDLQE